MARVAILIVVRNESRFVEAAVESVLSQTWRDLEIAIADDGSSDDTPFRLERIRDKRVKLLRFDESKGLAFRLNELARATDSEFIARMDGDDVCEASRIERQMTFLAANTEIGIVGSAATLIDEAGSVVGTLSRPEGHEEIVRWLPGANPFIHSSVLCRRAVCELVGWYDTRMLRAQDLDLWIRAHRRTRLANMAEALLRYRMRERSQTLKSLYAIRAIVGGVRHGIPVGRTSLAVARVVGRALIDATPLTGTAKRRR